MKKECENPECKNIFTRVGCKKYCLPKCRERHYYYKNKDKYIKKARAWEAKNPDKKKAFSKASCDKFRKNNPERFNALMRNEYKRNKPKWKCRSRTNRILKSVKYKNPLHKKCSCGSKKNLALNFEVYPESIEGIKKAIENGKIYYKCKECRSK